ncbi:MAG: EMC3/TMCO1 family protein, partial [archaeon]
MLSILDDIMNYFMALLSGYGAIPESTYFIMGVAAVLALVSNLSNRFLVDMNKVRSQVAEVKAWQKEFDKARKSGDKQLLAKAQKRQAAIMSVQSKMMFERMKVTFVFFIPFILVWQVLAKFYSSIGFVA